jgi:diadenosine tetraphosphate (Ap4A) HIT family hydrolase
MIDHPKPFQDFIKLPDERQAMLIKHFSKLTRELGANFAFRIYDENGKEMGSKTFEVIQAEC